MYIIIIYCDMRFCFWFFRHFRKHFSAPAVALTRTCRARSLWRFDRRPRSLLAELLYIDRDDNNIIYIILIFIIAFAYRRDLTIGHQPLQFFVVGFWVVPILCSISKPVNTSLQASQILIGRHGKSGQKLFERGRS